LAVAGFQTVSEPSIAIRYADHRPETSSDAGMHIDNN
jgi:hypothetical protein